MDNDIQSIADIANLLRERDKHGSLISDSQQPSGPSLPRVYQNILDSKIFSEKEYRSKGESENWEQPSKIIHNRRHLQIGSNMGSQMHSALPSALYSFPSPSHVREPSIPEEEEKEKVDWPTYIRLTLLDVKGDQELPIFVLYEEKKKELNRSKVCQFELGDCLDLQFRRGDGVAIEPSQNLEDQMSKYHQDCSATKMVNFFYEGRSKIPFSYKLQFSKTAFYTRAQVQLSLNFEPLYQRITIEDQDGQSLIEADIKGQSQVKFNIILDFTRLKDCLSIILNDEGAKFSTKMRVQSGGYPLQDEDQEYRGLVCAEVVISDQLLE